jgi:hypothetical protein
MHQPQSRSPEDRKRTQMSFQCPWLQDKEQNSVSQAPRLHYCLVLLKRGPNASAIHSVTLETNRLGPLQHLFTLKNEGNHHCSVHSVRIQNFGASGSSMSQTRKRIRNFLTLMRRAVWKEAVQKVLCVRHSVSSQNRKTRNRADSASRNFCVTRHNCRSELLLRQPQMFRAAGRHAAINVSRQ